MPNQHQNTDIQLISEATQTLVSIRGFFPEVELQETPSESTSKQTTRNFPVRFWELRSGLALGYTSLSACRCGRFKLLYTCADAGLVVLVCVNQQSTKRLILQAKQQLSDSCGGVEYVWAGLCMCVNECRQQQQSVDCSKCTKFNYWTDCGEQRGQKGQCLFWGASSTSHWHVRTAEIDFFIHR